MVVRKMSEQDYIISIEKGENLVETLKNWADENGFEAGTISGIGGAGQIDFATTRMNGYIKNKADKYEVYEITSVLGNISKEYENGNTKVHIHGTWADETFKTYAGHVFEMKVMIVIEVYVRVFPNQTIVRKSNPTIPHLKNIIKEDKYIKED